MNLRTLSPADVRSILGCGKLDQHVPFEYENSTLSSRRAISRESRAVQIKSGAIEKLCHGLSEHLFPTMCLNEIETIIGVCDEGLVFSSALAHRLNDDYHHPKRKRRAIAAYATANAFGGVDLFCEEGMVLRNPGSAIIVQAFVYPENLCPTAHVAAAIKTAGGKAVATAAVFNHGVPRDECKGFLGTPMLYFLSDLKS